MQQRKMLLHVQRAAAATEPRAHAHRRAPAPVPALPQGLPPQGGAQQARPGAHGREALQVLPLREGLLAIQLDEGARSNGAPETALVLREQEATGDTRAANRTGKGHRQMDDGLELTSPIRS
ncbi:hypothetical protein EVAR_30415_1 [Eumeta japonica]|uniref:Uncharacterized protein n=1 Tax=Eumeta variegata TaxID=151549 RepID=A0A4C1W7Z2_EUMVA|nr:hypothetical protein EVAR_30415_1 [Eumeta japonica]